MTRFAVLLSAILVAAAGAAAASPVLRQLSPERYQYAEAGDGSTHLVDLWGSADDLREAARYDPERQNVYHLFTRQNPSISQPLLMGNGALLGLTNFNAQRRTVMLVHGWMDNVASNFNSVLVPAFLQADDVNVIVVDWSSGAGTINYFTAVTNTVPSGENVAHFISWLTSATGVNINSFHIVGHNLGGHQAGIIGRNIGGAIPYITALDPAFTGWITNDDKFRNTDGVYTEVIHTNAGGLGYLSELGDADFYPNGGIRMPGCNTNECDSARSYHYMAESVVNSGFRGTRCASYLTAMTGNCYLWGGLLMGGVVPKTGSSGVYYLETNAAPPFSQS